MTGVKIAGVVGVTSWTTGMVASVAQVTIGSDTLVPLGVVVASLLFLVAAAIKVSRWVDAVNRRLADLEVEVKEIDEELEADD